MNINILHTTSIPAEYDVAIIPFFEDKQLLVSELSDTLTPYLAANDIFKGKEESTYIFTAVQNKKLVHYILAGLGNQKDFSAEILANSIGLALKAASAKKISHACVLLDNIKPDFLSEHHISSAAKASALGAYKFDKFLSDKKEDLHIDTITFVSSCDCSKSAVKNGAATADFITIARELVDEPANIMKPSLLAKRAKEVCEKAGLEIEIFNREDIAKLQMNAFLNVAKGSDEEPKLIVMRYHGNPSSNEITALVGKGLTYDSGGYSIKPTSSMLTMKSDMGGSAAVIGAMAAIAASAPKINIVGIVAACENMISGHAYLPGDILTSMSGKTIEIVNTDAEGRLTLADAITYAIRKENASRIVDICTLTGAAVVALSEEYAGIITKDTALWNDVEQASEKSLEPVWRMPINKALEKKNKSSVADLKNSGGRWGGCSSAGAFVGEFTEGKPWVHMDIAGTAFIETEKPYFRAGATGYGVHLLCELVKIWAEK